MRRSNCYRLHSCKACSRDISGWVIYSFITCDISTIYSAYSKTFSFIQFSALVTFWTVAYPWYYARVPFLALILLLIFTICMFFEISAYNAALFSFSIFTSIHLLLFSWTDPGTTPDWWKDIASTVFELEKRTPQSDLFTEHTYLSRQPAALQSTSLHSNAASGAVDSHLHRYLSGRSSSWHTQQCDAEERYQTSNNQENEVPNFTYCTICCAVRPFGSHHCNICGRCVLRMDHHCSSPLPLHFL